MQERIQPTSQPATIATAVACAAALAWAQLAFSGMPEGDSWFHTRAAQQLGEHGVHSVFPQAAFSTWSDRYSDKDLLFHVLLVPFVRTGDDLIARGKFAVILFDGLMLVALAIAISKLGLRFGPLWILLFISSHPFVLRQLLVLRPHLLALILLPIEITLILRRRPLWLGLSAGIHVFAHSSFVLVPGLVLGNALALRLHRQALPWRCLTATVVAIALALVMHPQFPHNLGIAYDQIVEVARSVWGQRSELPHDLFGGELFGISPSSLAAAIPAWLPAASGVIYAMGSRSTPRLSVRSSTLVFIALGLLSLTFLSGRFLPFFAIASTLLAGSVWTEIAGDESWRTLARRRPIGAGSAAALLAGCLAFGQANASLITAPTRMARLRSPEVYRSAIKYLDGVAEREDQIYHSFWWAFSWLYHVRPEGRYIVGLDPIYLYRFDSYLFSRMLEAHRGRGDVYAVIAEDFGARWIFLEKVRRTQPLRKHLRGEPRIVRRYADSYAEVYEVIGVRETER